MAARRRVFKQLDTASKRTRSATAEELTTCRKKALKGDEKRMKKAWNRKKNLENDSFSTKSLNCRSFQAIASCPPDSSFSKTTHQHTERAAQKTDCGPTVQISSKKPMVSKFAECKLGRLSRVVSNVGAYRKLKTKPKTIAELKESLQVFWSNLPQGPIDKTVKDFSN